MRIYRETKSRRRGTAVSALVIAACCLVAPAVGAAESHFSSVNANVGASGQPTAGDSASSGPGYSSVNAITGASTAADAGARPTDSGSGYSSVNAITGAAPEATPTVVAAGNGDDGFDWGAAGLGAGVALALAAAGAMALALRGRTARAGYRTT